jgi:5-methylcytosine-specific restriction endonuclease McrA
MVGYLVAVLRLYTTPRPRRASVARRDCAPRCIYCLRHFTPYNPATVDHIVPRYYGGTDHRCNLIPACRECNHRKGAQTLAEFCGATGLPLRKVRRRIREWTRSRAIGNCR